MKTSRSSKETISPSSSAFASRTRSPVALIAVFDDMKSSAPASSGRQYL